MKKKWLITIIGIGILSIVGLNIFLLVKSKFSHSNVTSVQTFEVKMQQMSDTLVASGTVTPREEERIFKDESMGSIKDIFVSEGQEVRKGTELFRYDEEEINNKMKLLEISRSRLSLELEQYREKLDNLEADFKHNLKDTLQIEESLRQAENNKNELERQVKYIMLSIQQNEMELTSLLKKRDNLVVKSVVSGVVKKITRNANKSTTDSQDPIIHIASNEPYKVKGTITEFDSVFVKAGQPVKVRAKVLSSEVWEGKIESIQLSPSQNVLNAGVEKNASVTSYPYEVALVDNRKGLQDGYHVSVEIQINVKDNVLTLPHDVTFAKDSKEFVFVVVNNRLQKREITIGLMNDEFKEVLTGVNEGDIIVRHPKVEWKDGMEVKVDAPTS
ncbi:efflux RND transporter periplasmic adaptor subunit [Paenibacillus chondroitinus]|uniref:Efflux RND transporter periplasmic adaptor subunit n=1 Tax=Paenibacillus chondroitinus TaxID=59842 RepID=A0ABU6DKC3_9BACL|nr:MULTISPECIES: efflux RND transporter periplasmic adaptor subunit [Paenibacillus]MCY9657570.1 efflux RND transporter periplasmic adaptor subunit [Paenibacillus anseongense]MEB4797780.1 efflux RND transporter periplasmic adaptor subunit [Paenibacillus chondroitinus]